MLLDAGLGWILFRYDSERYSDVGGWDGWTLFRYLSMYCGIWKRRHIALTPPINNTNHGPRYTPSPPIALVYRSNGWPQKTLGCKVQSCSRKCPSRRRETFPSWDRPSKVTSFCRNNSIRLAPPALSIAPTGPSRWVLNSFSRIVLTKGFHYGNPEWANFGQVNNSLPKVADVAGSPWNWRHSGSNA